MMSRGAHEANMESAARAGYGKVAEQAYQIAKLERVLALAKKAVAYHRLGYDLNSSFDANAMLAIMDELGEATDAA